MASVPALVYLVLDTAAPQITWGAIAGTTAGELLQVAYTVDEQGIVNARLVLADGRELAVTVLEDRLEVLLPPDAPAGSAQLVAELADDVANTATATLDIPIVGAVAVPQDAPGPGPARRRTARQTITAPLVLRARAGAERLGRRPTARTVVVRCDVRVRTVTPERAHLRRPLELGVRTGNARLAATASASAVVVARSHTSVRRRDGRALEEALLLDLL